MSIIRINYYDGYDLNSVEIYEIEEDILNELNYFIENGKCISNIYEQLIKYNQYSENREYMCVKYIENNCKKIKFDKTNIFQLNLK